MSELVITENFESSGNKSKLSIVERIGLVFDLSRHSKLESAFLEKIDNELIELAAYFNTTNIQALFLANIIPLNFRGRSISPRDLIDWFECNPMKIMKYSNELESLCALGLIKKQRAHRNRLTGASVDYSVSEHVLEAIRDGKKLEPKKVNLDSDIYQILENIADIWDQVDDNELIANEAIDQVKNIIISYPHIPLFKKLSTLDLYIQDAFLFLFLIWRKLNNEELVNLDRATEGIIERGSNKIRYIRGFLDSENQLIKKDLVELLEAQFTSNTEIKLTDKSLGVLEECGLKIYTPKSKKRNGIINPEDIIQKNLIYNNEELKQLSLIRDLLEESNFLATQQRLGAKKLPKGVTILLHGASGTGKTESVLQLAKSSGRQILKVDISQSKSAYFGESEKRIKKIFTAYKEYAKEADKCPILFINEADGLINQRSEISKNNNAVLKTENTIQTILLEEMELFEGILLCTSNLSSNFDSAFDRRFLFKINFKKPDTTLKSQIWKLKLPNLSEAECQTLATQFDFSGGQIDNITRKAEIFEVIHAQSVSFNQIQDFCREEIFGTNRVKIGF